MENISRFNRRLRTTIILSFLVPFIILLLAAGTFFYYISKQTMEEELGRRLITVAQVVAVQAKDWGFATLSPGDESSKTYEWITNKLKTIKDSTRVKKIYIFDKDDRLFADSNQDYTIGSLYFSHALHERELTQIKNGLRPVSSVLFKGEDGLFYKSGFAPILNHRNEAIGFIGVEASADFFASLEKFRHNITVLILLGTLLTVLIGLVVASMVVSPLKALVNAAKDIGEGKMETEIKIGSRNEIGFLAHSINEMKEKIVERDSRLKAMMHGIAHEVRNPLGGMELFSGLLKEELKSDSEKLKYVEKIQTEITNLKAVVEEFLDFARSVEPSPTKGLMPTFIEDIKLNFLNELDSKKIDFEARIPDSAQTMFFDPDQMRRALLNIVKNAIDATPEGGKITFECDGSNNHNVISVIDSGSGIGEDILGQVFDPFFTTKERGSGLGLSFARKIVISHKGEIDIESAKGKGTLVRITIPGQDNYRQIL
jgi:signal transduction histidine kinase